MGYHLPAVIDALTKVHLPGRASLHQTVVCVLQGYEAQRDKDEEEEAANQEEHNSRLQVEADFGIS
jgi:hypothetical protein